MKSKEPTEQFVPTGVLTKLGKLSPRLWSADVGCGQQRLTGQPAAGQVDACPSGGLFFKILPTECTESSVEKRGKCDCCAFRGI